MIHRSDRKQTQQMKKAFYAGSFNPFTVGHADIVERALALFDTVVIGVGVNVAKMSDEEISERVDAIKSIYPDNDRVQVLSYSTLTTEAALNSGSDVLLRSVRDVSDYEYERNLADVNRRISGLDTILLTARPELAYISSSMVRELRHFGFPADEFIPAKENCQINETK